jgi:hypothetical protein
MNLVTSASAQKSEASPVADNVSALINAATHNLRLPKYDGSDDPLSWLHHCDQFFLATHTQRQRRYGLLCFTCMVLLSNGTTDWGGTRVPQPGQASWSSPPLPTLSLSLSPTCNNALGELCHLHLDGSLDE